MDQNSQAVAVTMEYVDKELIRLHNTLNYFENEPEMRTKLLALIENLHTAFQTFVYIPAKNSLTGEDLSL